MASASPPADRAGLRITERPGRRSLVERHATAADQFKANEHRAEREVNLFFALLPDLPITETIDEVIVYHADRLHMGIHDRRTNETKSATLKVLAERVGCVRSRRNLSHDLPSVKLWPSVNESPAIGVEASELFLDFEKGARVGHGGLDLHAVANDLSI